MKNHVVDASSDLLVATLNSSSLMLKGVTVSLPCVSRYVSSTSNTRGQRMSRGPLQHCFIVFRHHIPWWTSEMVGDSTFGLHAKGPVGWEREMLHEFSP